jgi:hypothetical protein
VRSHRSWKNEGIDNRIYTWCQQLRDAAYEFGVSGKRIDVCVFEEVEVQACAREEALRLANVHPVAHPFDARVAT